MIERGDHVRHKETGVVGEAESLARGKDDVVTVRWGHADGKRFASEVPAKLLEKVVFENGRYV